MPKKKKSKKAKEKPKKEKKIEESELEEIAEEVPENQDIGSFLQPPPTTSAPILEKVETSEPLEEIVPQSSETPEDETQDTIEYIDPKTGYDTLAEYETRVQQAVKSDPDVVVGTSTPIHIDDMRTNLRSNVNRTFEINPELQQARRASANIGKTEEEYHMKAGELDKNDTSLPFEQKERKYKGRAI
jgi:hypothetical protein